MTTETQARHDLAQFGKKLHDAGHVAATDGNLSVRLDDGRILATPTGMSKGMMHPEDMVIVDLDGQKCCGERNPSSEVGMHLLVYRTRPDINAVVHAHPVTATGFAAAGMSLEEPLVSEIVISLGAVPLAKYGTPGTPELTDALLPFVPDYDAILMANHGVVTYGPDLLNAYMKMETVEHFARIALVTQQLGRQQLLSKEEVDKLLECREKYEGVTSVAKMLPRLSMTRGN
jgi:L-fuculose-phosphate aldolase